MDTIPPDEFIAIFHRVAQHVRLGRVRNPREIRGRIRRILRLNQLAYRKASRASTISKYRKNYINLRKLDRAGIHNRIWDEAVANPGGIIDETLDYGYAGAQRRAMARSRARAGRLGRLRRR